LGHRLGAAGRRDVVDGLGETRPSAWEDGVHRLDGDDGSRGDGAHDGLGVSEFEHQVARGGEDAALVASAFSCRNGLE
jgi:hypothetical protein